MKRNKVLAVAIPIMLLAGCGGVDKAESKQNDKAESKQEDKVEQKTPTNKQLTKEEYESRIDSLILVFDEKYSDYETIGNQPARRSTQGLSTETSLELFDGMIRTADDFIKIIPPQEYEELQKEIVESMNHYKKGFELLKEIYTAKDKSTDEHLEKVKVSDEELKKAQESWNAVCEKLNGKNAKNHKENIKPKSTVLTEKQLIDLDKKAGMDTDTVKENTSKTGKEFAGTWGFLRDGKVVPNYILKEDKTFEVYSGDEYPSKKNYATGTWSYNKDKMILELTIKKAYQAGESFRPKRKVVSYKVQNFTDSKMQLFDEELPQIYRFMKQK
ncbi:DUF3994 domain-containing protein [Bacillus sp. BP-3]|uniref:DUF3994 domain-containing protein n=1 Tax=Bacillus sp. BP-3 TaxID=3022773 RepID=UPI00232DEB9F|nr:DUF3994 domain-containing protein [Bacillus sp. BP-3]MDC2863588.1 DUF3994 domain-containing protein [Bacillus sp. BP-3]